MGNGLHRPLLDQLPLHLGKTREQSHNQRCHLPESTSVDQTIESPDVDTRFLKRVESIDDFDLGPTQAIEFRDHQLITLDQGPQCLLQLLTI